MVPEASFTYSLDGTKVKFNSTAKYVTSVLWDFGDGTTSTELNPEHVYDDLGIYDVTLNAKGISGDAFYTLRLKLIQAAKLNNSGWSIVGCDSEEPKEAEWSDSPIAGLAQAAIDGNLTTFGILNGIRFNLGIRTGLLLTWGENMLLVVLYATEDKVMVEDRQNINLR